MKSQISPETRIIFVESYAKEARLSADSAKKAANTSLIIAVIAVAIAAAALVLKLHA